MNHVITQKEFIALLNDRVAQIARQFDTETEQIADFRHWYDDLGYGVTGEIEEIDRSIIRRAAELAGVVKDEGNYTEEMKNFWAWNPGLIAAGTFPLEKLPAHVRSLAKELYYDHEK